MAKKEHWMVKVLALARTQMVNTRSTMESMVIPQVRRPDTSTLLTDALLNPESQPPGGRDALAKFLRETYGEGARHVIPFLGTEEEELQEEVNGPQTPPLE